MMLFHNDSEAVWEFKIILTKSCLDYLYDPNKFSNVCIRYLEEGNAHLLGAIEQIKER